MTEKQLGSVAMLLGFVVKQCVALGLSRQQILNSFSADTLNKACDLLDTKGN